MPPFTDARLKIQRANKHIADAKDRIGIVTGRDGQSSWQDINPDTGRPRIHYRLAKLDELPEIALIVGDAIHNLKTALDYGWSHLMTNLVKGGLNKFSKFPVYPTANDLKAALKSNRIDTLLPALFVLMLADIKPYSGGDEFIWAIHKYDIADKHRLLIPTTNYGNVTGIQTNDRTDFWTPGGELEKEFVVEFLVPNAQIKDKGHITVEIVFKDGPLKSLEVLESLQHFSSRVLCVIELFAKL